MTGNRNPGTGRSGIEVLSRFQLKGLDVPRMLRRLVISSLAFFASITGLGAAVASAPPTPLTAEQILQKFTFPAEFSATVFAAPPEVSYPVFISAAPDGTLFIGCDQNGS